MRRRRARATARRCAIVLVPLLAAAAVGGCGTVLGVDFGDAVLDDGDSAPGAQEASAGSDGSSPDAAVPVDGAAPVDATVDTGYQGACRGTAGPLQVVIDAGAVLFCIDTTEVTRGQYEVFRTSATPTSIGGVPPFCGFLAAFSAATPGEPDDYPVHDVTWCEAWGFCKWAGKHLCGGVDGKPLPQADQRTTKDEWFVACSNNVHQNFPYGPTSVPGYCNTWIDGGALAPVSSFPMCRGSNPAVWDMLGNVGEYYDSNKYDDAGTVTEWQTKPSMWSNMDYGACDQEHGTDPGSPRQPGVGFRCCSSP